MRSKATVRRSTEEMKRSTPALGRCRTMKLWQSRSRSRVMRLMGLSSMMVREASSSSPRSMAVVDWAMAVSMRSASSDSWLRICARSRSRRAS